MLLQTHRALHRADRQVRQAHLRRLIQINRQDVRAVHRQTLRVLRQADQQVRLRQRRQNRTQANRLDGQVARHQILHVPRRADQLLLLHVHLRTRSRIQVNRLDV